MDIISVIKLRLKVCIKSAQIPSPFKAAKIPKTAEVDELTISMIVTLRKLRVRRKFKRKILLTPLKSKTSNKHLSCSSYLGKLKKLRIFSLIKKPTADTTQPPNAETQNTLDRVFSLNCLDPITADMIPKSRKRSKKIINNMSNAKAP